MAGQGAGWVNMKELVKAVLDLQYALEKNGINSSSLEISLSAKEFDNFEYRYRYSSDCFGLVPPPTICSVVGVPFKARPRSLKERTDAVCAKIAGGHIQLQKVANG
jgi:hypothetical protein